MLLGSAFCAATTKACVAVFYVRLKYRPRCLLPHSVQFALVPAAALCAISIALLLLHSLQFPLSLLMVHSVQISLRGLLLHFCAASTEVPVAASCAKFTKVSYCCLWCNSIGACDAAPCGTAITAFCCSAGCCEETRLVLHILAQHELEILSLLSLSLSLLSLSLSLSSLSFNGIVIVMIVIIVTIVTSLLSLLWFLLVQGIIL